ncbi:MAG: bifunctional chorismate mutase/prephenate dehydratase, partial [Chloroflexi bacterium]|nr:bifunctional chorismate mutase/prephenate dehydratase [Chloroflexota bacterium]
MAKVAFQGEKGAYSEEAIQQFLGAGAETVPCRSLEDIFAAVESGMAEQCA